MKCKMSNTHSSRIFFSSRLVSDMVNMKIRLSNCNSHFVSVLNFVSHYVSKSSEVLGFETDKIRGR